jgi:hypothetical protein
MKLAVFLFAFLMLAVGSVSAVSTVLDDVEPGSLATWYQYYSGYNPTPTYSEIGSPYDDSTAIKTAVSGNTVMYCDTKYIYKDFEVSGNTDTANLQAYLEFWYDGTYYNFPFLEVVLSDNQDNMVGYHIWYGKNVVGGLYQSYIQSDPSHYTEFPSDKGFFTMQFSDMGSNIDFSKIRVYMMDYTCVGNNYIILDHLVYNGDAVVGDGGNNDIPEFGVAAAAIVLIGAMSFIYIKRK